MTICAQNMAFVGQNQVVQLLRLCAEKFREQFPSRTKRAKRVSVTDNYAEKLRQQFPSTQKNSLVAKNYQTVFLRTPTAKSVIVLVYS